jgi:hypothetical protein
MGKWLVSLLLLTTMVREWPADYARSGMKSQGAVYNEKGTRMGVPGSPRVAASYVRRRSSLSPSKWVDRYCIAE